MNFLTYFSERKKKNFLVTSEDIICDFCKSQCKDMIFIHTGFNKKSYSMKEIVCRDCLHKIKLKNEQDECRQFLITHQTQSDFQPLPLLPTLVLPGKDGETVFSAALKREEGCIIEDYTRYALKESIEGAQIGADVSARIDELDKPLHGVEGLKVLDGLFAAKPEITSNVKLQIEEKEGVE